MNILEMRTHVKHRRLNVKAGVQIPHPLSAWRSNSPPPGRQRGQMPEVCPGGMLKLRFDRYITNMISTIGWQSLEERRAIARLTLMYKIVQGLVNVSTTPLLPSGRQPGHTSHLSFSHLQSNKNCHRSSFFPCTIPEWNSLPLSSRSATSIQTSMRF